MEVTKTMVAIVVAACLTVGAAGSYLVTRGAGPTKATDPSTTTVSLEPDGSPSGGVEHSEEVVSDAPAPAPVEAARKAAPSRPAPAPAPAPSRPQPSAPPPAPVPPPPIVESAPPPPPVIEPARPVAEPEPARAVVVEPPKPEYQDLVLSSDSVIGLQVETPVTSETARVEDAVSARVVRDVKVGDHIAIPAGSKAHGEVTLVERGGKLKDRARLGVRFTSIVLADGTKVPISTETIYREGDAPGKESTAKIGGGAIGGAIIGGLLGGAKGAAIGSAIGGGAGSAAVMAGGRNPATLSSGSPVTIRLQQPATVPVEK